MSGLTNHQGLWANQIAKAHNLLRHMRAGVALLKIASIHQCLWELFAILEAEKQQHMAKWSTNDILMSKWLCELESIYLVSLVWTMRSDNILEMKNLIISFLHHQIRVAKIRCWFNIYFSLHDQYISCTEYRHFL